MGWRRAVAVAVTGMVASAAGAEPWAQGAPLAPPIKEPMPQVLGGAPGQELRLRVVSADRGGDSWMGELPAIQHRLQGTMVDLFPGGKASGFHLSAGSRYYTRVNYARDAMRATNGLLFVPEWRGGGWRAGFNRYTPAVTMGYARALGERVLLGLETGAMMGRAYATPPRALNNRLNGDRGGVNPMAALVVGMHF